MAPISRPASATSGDSHGQLPQVDGARRTRQIDFLREHPASSNSCTMTTARSRSADPDRTPPGRRAGAPRWRRHALPWPVLLRHAPPRECRAASRRSSSGPARLPRRTSLTSTSPSASTSLSIDHLIEFISDLVRHGRSAGANAPLRATTTYRRREMHSWSRYCEPHFIAAPFAVACLPHRRMRSNAAKTGGYAHIHLSPGADRALDDRDVGGAGGDHLDQDLREPAFLRWRRRSTPKPGLAESWTVSADKKTYTFKLRQGVKWHDGKPFTADDVKFSVEKIIRPYHSRGRVYFGDVAGDRDARSAHGRLQAEGAGAVLHERLPAGRSTDHAEALPSTASTWVRRQPCAARR